MTAKHYDQDLTKNFPKEVKQIFEIFSAKKHDSIRLVGGCVRDMLFSRNIKDFDFATKFLPQDAIKILQEHNIKAIETGIKFGTITAVINDKHFEITTLRKDNENDGRHCEPEFVDDYMQDAARRDFTVNALYLNNHGLIYDYFDGLHDITQHRIRFIGDAEARIQEDFLRILRFFRFSARYAGILDIEGLEACIKYKQNIKQLSSDRIRNEIFSIISSSSNDRLLWILQEIEDNKIREEIFSTSLKLHNLSNLLNLEEAFKIKLSNHIKFASLIIRTAALEEINLRLNFSNIEKKYFNFMNHSLTKFDFKTLRRLLSFEDKNLIRDSYLLYLSQNSHNIHEAKDLLNYIENFTLPKFPLNGDDLLQMNIDGKKIGELLLQAKEIWIESNFGLKKEELLKIIIR